MDFELTTIYKTSKWFFLCFRVSEHFPSTGVLELLYADNFMFTGQRSGSGSNFFKTVKEIMLQWALVSILYETGIPSKGRVIDQSDFSFLIWLICAEYWILTISIKNPNHSGLRLHQICPFQFHVLFYQHVGSKLWSGSFYCKHDKLFHKPDICLGNVNYCKIYTFL